MFGQLMLFKISKKKSFLSSLTTQVFVGVHVALLFLYTHFCPFYLATDNIHICHFGFVSYLPVIYAKLFST